MGRGTQYNGYNRFSETGEQAPSEKGTGPGELAMQESSQHTQQSIHLLAQQYFAFLAEQFPVMCASDEFYFMPRAEEAYRFYAQMDDVDNGALDECIRRLRGFER